MADSTLRVLLVVADAVGGIRRHVDVLVERLPAFGVEVAVSGAVRGDIRAQLDGAHVIHAHGLRAGVVAGSARTGSSPALVTTWHNAALVSGLRLVAHRLASRYAARAADLTLGASPDLAEAARRAGSRNARDTFVVAPPLGPPTRSREDVRSELGVGDRPLVLAIGRLHAQKRLDVLVDAAAGWADRTDRPTVMIAGTGPDLAALRAQVRERRAAVSFLSMRNDVPDLLAAADVVALPSAWEARSLVAQEALRAGVPLVTTPVGGLPDLLGNAGLVFPVGDSARLRDALLQLTTSPKLAKAVADAGLQRAASWPTIDESLAELVSTYRSLVPDDGDAGAS